MPDLPLRTERHSRRGLVRSEAIQHVRASLVATNPMTGGSGGRADMVAIRKSIIGEAGGSSNNNNNNNNNNNEQEDTDSLLFQKLVETIFDTNDDDGDHTTDEDEEGGKKAASWWTFMLTVPIMFTYVVATRMQFIYVSLYGRDGLHLNNALSILAIGMIAGGRATAPPLLARYFHTPSLLLVLTSTTLVGCVGMLLIPVIGGRANFNQDGMLRNDDDTATVGTIAWFYCTMYVQGLAETVGGWDVLIKFETRQGSPARQQLAFRRSFVATALGSATAFFVTSYLYSNWGLYGCILLGTVTGALNIVFSVLYVACRWKSYAAWRDAGDQKRTRDSKTTSPLMRVLQIDGLDADKRTRRTSIKRSSTSSTSTRQLTFKSHRNINLTMMLEQKKQGEENRGSRSLMIDNNSGSKNNHPPNGISSIRTTTTRYTRPNNYLEFRKQLEHQTAERIDTNLNNIRNKTPQGSIQERLMQVPNTQLLAVIDPSLLLSHSQHIRWPDHFQKQITVMKWFCILALSLGAMMISSQFAIYSLYLHDVWKVSPVFAGTSMAIGELSGMITLMASIYWDTNKISKKKSVSTNDGDNITSNDEGNKKNNDCRHRRTSITTLGTVVVKDQKSDVGIGRNSSCCSKCLRTPSLLLQVPSMFVMCCLAAVIPLSLLGFVKPQYDNEEQFEEEEKLLGTSNVSDWPTGLYFALLSGILIGLVNSVLVR